ncbi:MAG: DUF6054 family protein [Micrococcales bacterium]|nr:DUF6054 family protein [Micrococcales bacterium]
MAKYERRIRGDFAGLLARLDKEIVGGSVSAHLEDRSDYESAGVRCSVRVYERYSVVGGNRLSLSVTVVGHDNDLFVSAIASGGSQAMFFKINTWGEGTFLRHVIRILDDYPG